MTHSNDRKAPPVMKQSRAKIWIRTVIFAVFFTLFGLALYRDIQMGHFSYLWALITFVPCLVIGFWMCRLVPMQVHSEFQVITFSFDRIYFALILTLVILKAITGKVLYITVLADVIMCVILGLMVGRLSGICLRVHGLKGRFSKPDGSRSGT
jgi:Na+/H+ antiporter NhaA